MVLRILCLVGCLLGAAGIARAEDSLKVFERRILPIMNSQNASSCSECHLSGVDLKDYIRPSQAETFAALRNGGMIDVKNPAKSKLLDFIARTPEKPGLIKPEVRKAELDAFKAWITAAVADPQLLAATTKLTVGPSVPDEVIRHARQDRVLQSFIDNIWLESGRCAGCHSSDLNAEQVKKNGDQMSWIVPNDPAATLAILLDHDLIDVDSPEKSLVIAKPTMQVKHGGGQKMVIGDRSFQQFAAFLNDYAAAANGQYKKAEDIPAASPYVVGATDSWLKITDIPAKYGKLVLRAEVYPAQGKGWAKAPLIVGDRGIATNGLLWQQHMSLSLERGSALATRLAKTPQKERRIPGGKYLLKIWVATEADFAANRVAEQGEAFETTITSQWPGGYGSMTTVPFPQRKPK